MCSLSQRFKAGYVLLQCLFSISLDSSFAKNFSTLLVHLCKTIILAQSQDPGPLHEIFYLAKWMWGKLGPFGFCFANSDS